jgi:hypothetical protein
MGDFSNIRNNDGAQVDPADLLQYGRGATFPVSIFIGPRSTSPSASSVTLNATTGTVHVFRATETTTITTIGVELAVFTANAAMTIEIFTHGVGGTDLTSTIPPTLGTGTTLVSAAAIGLSAVGINEHTLGTPFAITQGALYLVRVLGSGSATGATAFSAAALPLNLPGDSGAGRWQSTTIASLDRPGNLLMWLKTATGKVIGRPLVLYSAPAALSTNMRTFSGAAANYSGVMVRMARRTRVNGIQTSIGKVVGGAGPGALRMNVYQGGTLVAQSVNTCTSADIASGAIQSFQFSNLILTADIDYVFAAVVDGAGLNDATNYWLWNGAVAGAGTTKGFPFDVYPPRGNPYYGITGVYTATNPTSFIAGQDWTVAATSDGLPFHRFICQMV